MVKRSGNLARSLVALLAVAFALTACLIDTTPRTPAPPTPTVTPRPTPTPTPGVLPILQPTFAPTRVPLATATAPLVAAPDIRASGQIVYLAAQEGRRDILSVEANGREQRRLVTGTYDTPVWSPDGSRFAVYGATTSGGLSDQLAIFDGDGRAQARFPLAGVGVGQPTWSPDGRALLCFLRDPTETSGARTAWIADGEGLSRLTLPEGATPWRWTPTNRVGYIMYPPGGQRRVSQSNPLAVWSIDPDGGPARREAEGVMLPLGWSPDGQTFYALDGLLIDQGGQAVARATSVIALDRRSGTTRTLVSATSLLGSGRVTATSGTTGWFEGGTISPVGGALTLWLRSVGSTGTPSATAEQLIVAMVDDTGRLLARDTLRVGASPTGFAWSVGGILIAFFAASGRGNELHILSPGGQPALVYAVSATLSPANQSPSWSPDSRWVATAGSDGLEIVATVGSARNIVIVEGAASGPAWRPASLR